MDKKNKVRKTFFFEEDLFNALMEIGNGRIQSVMFTAAIKEFVEKYKDKEFKL
jgi:hypothetical protein